MTLYLPDNSLRCEREEFVVGGKWPSKVLTWRYDAAFSASNNPPASTPVIDAWIAEMLDRWGEVSGLTFVHVAAGGRGEVDLLFQWVKDEHGDGAPLGSSSNALAHAFLPMEFDDFLHEGDTHMNGYYDYANWIDARTVLLHETGHALGLSHSTVRTSIMYPAYAGLRRELYPDDIGGIQALYGAPVVTPSAPLPLLTWPIPGFANISSGFYSSRSWGLHAAIDIPAPTGTPCLSSFDGVVKNSFFDTQGGNIVEIEDENGWLIRYVHMDASTVLTGARVQRGQQVGLSGNTGTASTGPHLHYAVWHREKTQALRVQPDPYAYRNSGYWAVDPRRLLEEDDMTTPKEVRGIVREELGHFMRGVLWALASGNLNSALREGDPGFIFDHPIPSKLIGDQAGVLSGVAAQLLPGMAPGPFVRIDNPGGSLHGQVHLLLFAHAAGTADMRRVVGDVREWDIYGGINATDVSWAEWESIRDAFNEGDPLPPVANK